MITDLIIYSVHDTLDIAEEEKLLSNLVVAGTELVSMIEEVVKNTERLISIAGNYNVHL